ncbi:MAG: hypothetical protein U0V70_12965 [Terriglobia bacterium]
MLELMKGFAMWRKKIAWSGGLLFVSLCTPGMAQEIRQDIGTKLLIPSSAKTAVFTSFLAILNQDSQQNTIHIQARNSDGSTLGEKDINLPAGGRFRSPDILGELGAGLGSFGPIILESTNGRLFSAVSEVSSSQGPAGYFPGVNVQTAWQQGFVLEVNDTGNQGTPGTVRTNLGLNTVDGNSATVSVQLLNDSGTPVGTVINTQIPGNGLNQINGVVRTLLQSGGAVTGQNGFLKIVANRPILAWASKVENGTNDPSFQIGVGAPTTVVSPTQVDVIDFRNNLLFLGLALLGTTALFLPRTKQRPMGLFPGTGVQQGARA